MPKPNCLHAKWRDGHCAEMGCANYVSKCPKHAIAGDDKAACNRDE